MQTVRNLASLAMLLVATPVLAGENGDCTCRLDGKDIAEGQTACLSLPTGQVLARCEMVLNNTAWKTIQKGCPSASAVGDVKPAEKS